MRGIRGLSAVLRVLCVAALSIAVGGVTVTTATTGKARAAGYETLMVPSARWGATSRWPSWPAGRTRCTCWMPSTPGPDVSNWVTAGNAMNTLAGKGISVAAPAGGAYSMYTNWEQDGSKQWDTFLSSELPDWLAANRGLAPGGHAVVGAAQGGYAAMALACFHPDRFGFAGSLSGFLYPSDTTMNGAILRACSNSAGWTARRCGVPRSWAGGSGTTHGCTPTLLAAEQHPDLGVEPEDRWTPVIPPP